MILFLVFEPETHILQFRKRCFCIQVKHAHRYMYDPYYLRVCRNEVTMDRKGVTRVKKSRMAAI
jgi:hypothetical protein